MGAFKTSQSIRPLFLVLTLTTATLCKRTEYSTMVGLVNGASGALWKASLIEDIDYENDTGLLKMASGTIEMKSLPNTGRARPRSLQTSIASGGALKTNSTYPASLMLRNKYPRCRSIAMVRNQGICASCWSIAAMTSVSDRYCIAESKPGKTAERFFSFQDSLECCSSCAGSAGKPCDGGYLYQAFLFAKVSGIVTGDYYGSNSLCKPYFMSPSFAGTITNPKCNTNCTITAATLFSTSGKNYTTDKLTITDYTFGKGEAAMIQELNEGGSIAAAIKVYSDLYLYTSGIYNRVFGAYLGGHAVRIVGYGVDNGVKYWVAANSWGATWGENGFFRIRRGTDECGIESSYFFAAVV